MGGKIKSQEYQGDMSLLEFPVPEAIIEVGITAARNLEGKDWNIFGKATSDPFAVLGVGATKHTTSTKKKTLEPKWGNDGYGDFLLFNPKQKISCEVFDDDLVTSDDFIGRLLDVDVQRLFSNPNDWLPIYEVDINAMQDEVKDKKKTGEVKLDLRIFELKSDVQCLKKPPKKHAGGTSFIMIQARSLRGLSKEETMRGAHLKIQWEDTTVESRRSKYLQNMDARLSEPAAQRMAEFLVTDPSMNLSVEKVSEVSGLPIEVIRKIMRTRPSFTCRWGQGFSGMLHKPEKAELKISLVIPKQDGLPPIELKTPFKIHDLFDKPDLTWDGVMKLERVKEMTEKELKSGASVGPFDVDIRIQCFGLHAIQQIE